MYCAHLGFGEESEAAAQDGELSLCLHGTTTHCVVTSSTEARDPGTWEPQNREDLHEEVPHDEHFDKMRSTPKS